MLIRVYENPYLYADLNVKLPPVIKGGSQFKSKTLLKNKRNQSFSTLFIKDLFQINTRILFSIGKYQKPKFFIF